MRRQHSHLTCRAEEAEAVTAARPQPKNPQLPEDKPEPIPPATDEPPNAKKPPKHEHHDEPMEPPEGEPPHIDPIARE